MQRVQIYTACVPAGESDPGAVGNHNGRPGLLTQATWQRMNNEPRDLSGRFGGKSPVYRG